MLHAHVMHIGSTVRGEIDEKYDALEALEAVLPAGTLSGAPKMRARQLIGELENNKRGIYGGAIGYIDFTGNMDALIAIRIAYKKNGKVFVRSGAGIVADLAPEKGCVEGGRPYAYVNTMTTFSAFFGAMARTAAAKYSPMYSLPMRASWRLVYLVSG